MSTVVFMKRREPGIVFLKLMYEILKCQASLSSFHISEPHGNYGRDEGAQISIINKETDKLAHLKRLRKLGQA